LETSCTPCSYYFYLFSLHHFVLEFAKAWLGATNSSLASLAPWCFRASVCVNPVNVWLVTGSFCPGWVAGAPEEEKMSLHHCLE
jgi:hypothetical protein